MPAKIAFESKVRDQVKSNKKIGNINIDKIKYEFHNEDDRFAVGVAYVPKGSDVEEVRVFLEEDENGNTIIKRIV